MARKNLTLRAWCWRLGDMVYLLDRNPKNSKNDPNTLGMLRAAQLEIMLGVKLAQQKCVRIGINAEVL